MKPVYSKPPVIKEYEQDGVKVTRYEMRKPKAIPMPRVYRKPTYRSK